MPSISLRNEIRLVLQAFYVVGPIFSFATAFVYSPDHLTDRLYLAGWIALGSCLCAASWSSTVRQRYSSSRQTVVFIIFVISTTVGMATWLDLTLGGSLINNDFTQDYLAGYALRHDINIYGPALRATSIKLFNFEAENYHPPFNALLFVPLSYLPYRAAFVVWSVVSLVGFGVLVVYALHSCSLARYPWLPLSFLLLLWKPFTSSIWLGQLSIFLALLIVLGFACLQRRHEKVAGLLFGCATLVKFFPGLLLLYVLTERRWSCAISWLATVTAGLALSVAVAGSENWFYYIRQILPEQMRLFASFPFNISVEGVLRTIFGPTEYFPPARELSPAIVQALVWIINGSLIIAACRLAAHTRSRDSSEFSFALFCITMLLASPLTWPHTCVILVLPIAMLLKDGICGQLGSWRVLIVVLGLFSSPDPVVLTAVENFYRPSDVPWYILVGLKTGFFGLLLVWVAFCLKLRRLQTRSAPAQLIG